MKIDQPWKWDASQQHARETLEHTLTNAPVLGYFDTHKQAVLSCDASPQGLGAALAQIYQDGSERVIAYASRTLQAAEENYSQTEMKGLSCVWAITHFHQYLWERRSILYTD